jgi:hypothetical protein
MSETQKMMLEEVMQEERKYREETRKNEMEEEGRERDELRKGREREDRERQARAASGTGTGTGIGTGQERGMAREMGTVRRGREESKEDVSLEPDRRPRSRLSARSARSLSRSRSRSGQLRETDGVGEIGDPRELENVSATGRDAA